MDIFFRIIVFTEMYIEPRRKKCVGEVKSYLIRAMFMYCEPIFFKIAQFGHLEYMDENVRFQECYCLHDVTVTGACPIVKFYMP